MQPTMRLADLSRLIGRHAISEGSTPLRVSGTYAIRAGRMNAERTHALMRSSVCIVAQGAKSVMLGDTEYRYGKGQVAVFSVDVPVGARVTRASRVEPYLTLKIDLDAVRVADLASKAFPRGLPRSPEDRAVYILDADAPLIDAAARLLELLDHPSDAELIAPLVIDEILIRLLRSPMGIRIAQMGRSESNLDRISKSVTWLRSHYDQPIGIEELAARVHLSASAFHRHFRAVTSMSPLQYQKVLRLQEARRLMLAAEMDVGDASRRVGYLSASQFSREYARLFGSAPTVDIRRLREESSRGRERIDEGSRSGLETSS